MKAFLIVSIAIIPIISTGAALGYSSFVARSYTQAERDLIDVLERFSTEQAGYFDHLVEIHDHLQEFLKNAKPDVHQLADAVATVLEAADKLDENYPLIISKILRRRSDANKASYILMVLAKVKPPRPQGGEQGSPGSGRSPSSSSRALEAAPAHRVRSV